MLILDRLFAITRGALFPWFFWTHNAGLLLTAAMLAVHGSLTVLGEQSTAAIAGVAGLGHILLTSGLILLLAALGRRVFAREAAVTGA